MQDLDEQLALSAMRKEVEEWRRTGTPSLLPEFLLRNGRGFDSIEHLDYPGPEQNCYMNAAEHAEEHGIFYVEGYAFLDGGPIRHAWCFDGQCVIETTLPKKQRQPLYFGVIFPWKRALDRMCETKIYGLFAPGEVLDTDFMSQVDPELSAHLKALETPGTT